MVLASYAILFFSAFLAATVLPFSSELTLTALLANGGSALPLLVVATVGNTLGSVVNWLLGLYLLHFKDRRWFYFSDAQIERGQHWFNRYGVWTLLLSWLPLGGDVLTLIAGVMRVRFWLFLMLVAIGKGLRYVAVIGVQQPLALF
ncbi:MAG: YqaA family protein [Porticoccaceae bacterium]